jgi:hypothetical protein
MPRPSIFFGLLEHQQGDLEGALRHVQAAVARSSATAAFHVNLGNLYRDLGRDLEAEQAYRQALALEPQDALSHYNLAVLQGAAGPLAGGQRQPGPGRGPQPWPGPRLAQAGGDGPAPGRSRPGPGGLRAGDRPRAPAAQRLGFTRPMPSAGCNAGRDSRPPCCRPWPCSPTSQKPTTTSASCSRSWAMQPPPGRPSPSPPSRIPSSPTRGATRPSLSLMPAAPAGPPLQQPGP